MRRRDERAAALVEFALVLPILIAFLLGILELGFMLQNQNVVIAGARSGARAAANNGDERLADYAVLDAVTSTMSNTADAGKIKAVVVFKPTSNGEMPPDCATRSVARTCNYYDAKFISTFKSLNAHPAVAQALFSGPCGISPDGNWCPTTRSVSQAQGLDTIAVRVTVKRQGITGMFGREQTISDQSVSTVEPRLEP